MIGYLRMKSILNFQIALKNFFIMSSASELTKAQNIISPKLKILSLSLISTSFVILAWSFLAKIPVNSNGRAYFVPAFKVKPFLTKSSGKLKLLSNKESQDIYKLLEKLSSITGKDRSQFIRTEKNISKIIDQYKFTKIENYKPINSLNNGNFNLKSAKNKIDELDNLVFKLDSLSGPKYSSSLIVPMISFAPLVPLLSFNTKCCYRTRV